MHLLANARNDRGRDAISAEWIAASTARRDAAGIREAVAVAIDRRVIAAGARLPTVRDLAAALGVGQHLVADVWAQLRTDGYVETRGRAGTFAAAPAEPPSSDSAPFAGWATIDLVHAHPDPRYLPSLAEPLALAMHPDRHYDYDDRIVPSLRGSVEARWPYPAEAFTVMPTPHAALLSVLETSGESRRSIAVEEPTLVRTVWALRQLNITTIAVQSDSEGPLPASLAEAIEQGAAGFIFQPSTGIPIGRRLTPGRRDELAEIIQGTSTWVMEEDPVGALSTAWGDTASLGERLPAQTIRHSQFWRAHGADLKLSVVGGPTLPVNRLVAYQDRFGLRTSPLLQNALHHQLEDAAANRLIAEGAQVYTRRHQRFTEALARVGMTDASPEGLFAWIPVADEDLVVQRLATFGFRVVSGGSSYLDPSPPGRIRIATTRLPDDPLHLDELANVLATVDGR